jgi:nucleoside-diphosphate-sugar epimerase
MLTSALKHTSVRRVVITSSAVAIVPIMALVQGDETRSYNAYNRVPQTPPPYPSAYVASKNLALKATEDFIALEKPHYSVINMMPTYIYGRNDLTTDPAKIEEGTNGQIMGVVFGKTAAGPQVRTSVHVDDVARSHVLALDEDKVKGNASFLLCTDEQPVFDDASDIVRKHFPKAVDKGVLKLGGHIQTYPIKLDSSETLNLWGPFKGLEEQVTSLVGHYLELVGEEKA